MRSWLPIQSRSARIPPSDTRCRGSSPAPLFSSFLRTARPGLCPLPFGMQVPAGFTAADGPAVSDAPPWALASMPHQLHSDPIELEGARSAFKSFFEQLFPGLKVPGDDFGQGDEQIDTLMHHAGGSDSRFVRWSALEILLDPSEFLILEQR